MMGATSGLKEEECAKSMGQKLIGKSTRRVVPLMGVKSMLGMELECASRMGQRNDYAALKDAKIKHKIEEYAKGMGQSATYATQKDAQIKLSKEECAKSMGQRSNYAARKDAQMVSSKEECAYDMGQRSHDAARKDA